MPTSARTPRPTSTRKSLRPASTRSERASTRSRLRSTSAGELPLVGLFSGARIEPDVTAVAARVALAIDGSGSPDSEAFQRSLAALYGAAYTLKFARKKTAGSTFKVPPLEGRWSAEGWNDKTKPAPRECWRWRLRLGVPRDVTPREVKGAIAQATGRKGGKLEGSGEASRVFLEKIPRGRCARVLHVGPFADEPRSFAAMARVLETAGLSGSLEHLEIYLTDPRRTSPRKLRTVLVRDCT